MGRMLVTVMLLVGGPMAAEAARERPLEELPKDAWDLAFVWTEPVKQAARETQRFDPISGLWFGLVEGSIKSIERTADFFFPQEPAAPAGQPDRPQKPLLRYTF